MKFLLQSWFSIYLFLRDNEIFCNFLTWYKSMQGLQSVVYLFVCLFGDFRPTREFFTHLETSLLPMKDYNFWVKVFNMPHLLCHGQTLYNGYLREPVTLTPVAERLAVELPLPVLTTKVCPDLGLQWRLKECWNLKENQIRLIFLCLTIQKFALF